MRARDLHSMVWISGGVTLVIWWFVALTQTRDPLVEVETRVRVALECPGLSVAQVRPSGGPLGDRGELSSLGESQTRVWWSCHARPLRGGVEVEGRSRSPLGPLWRPIVALFDLKRQGEHIRSEAQLFMLPASRAAASPQRDLPSSSEPTDRDSISLETWDSHGVAAHPIEDDWVYLHRLAGDASFSLLRPLAPLNPARSADQAWRELETLLRLKVGERPLALKGDLDGWRLIAQSPVGELIIYQGRWSLDRRGPLQPRGLSDHGVKESRSPPPVAGAVPVGAWWPHEDKRRAQRDSKTSEVLWWVSGLEGDAQDQTLGRASGSLYLGSPEMIGEKLKLNSLDLERVRRAIQRGDSLFAEGGVRPWLTDRSPPWRLSSRLSSRSQTTSAEAMTEAVMKAELIEDLPTPRTCLEVEERELRAWGALSAQESPHLLAFGVKGDPSWRFAPRVYRSTNLKDSSRFGCIWRPDEERWRGVISRDSSPRWFPLKGSANSVNTSGGPSGVWMDERGRGAWPLPKSDSRLAQLEGSLQRRVNLQASDLTLTIGGRYHYWRVSLYGAMWCSLYGVWLWLWLLKRSRRSLKMSSSLGEAIFESALTSTALMVAMIQVIALISLLSPIAYITPLGR